MKKIIESIYDLVASLTAAVLIIVLLFIFVFRVVGVSGESMLPTLQDGNWLAVTACKQTYHYKDIVIVTEPNALSEPIVKRVIATGGQWVNVDYDTGYVYVGDTADTMEKLDEPYTASLTDVRHIDDENEYPIQVPQGKLFCMGDNRNHSTDSRSYLVGFVDERFVMGKAFTRFIPMGQFDIYESSK